MVTAACLLVALVQSEAPPPVLLSPHVSVYPEANLSEFRVADVDDDEHVDIVFSTIIDGLVYAHGLGDGSLGELQTITPAIPAHYDTGDLDGDGQQDCVLAQLSGTTIQVLLAGDDGGFDLAGSVASTIKPASLMLGDADLDGHVDLLVAQTGVPRVMLFPGLGDGGFGPPYDVGAVESAHALALDDIDGDGWPDLVAASTELGDASLGVARSQGGGAFHLLQVIYEDVVLPVGDALAVDDVDGDGLGDVLMAGGLPGEEQGILVFYGQPGDVPRPPDLVPTVLPSQSVATGDFDADGLRDVAIGMLEGLVAVHLQVGGGALGEARLFAAAVGPVFLRSTDLDEDGFDDVLASNGVYLTRLFAMGEGNFRPCYGFPQPPRDHILADLDLDGRGDLVVALSQGGEGSGIVGQFLPGLPGGAFGRATSFDLGPDPRRVFAGQVDDGLAIDLLALHPVGLSVCLATGSGAFAAPVITPIPGGARTAAVGDLDDDHHADAVVGTAAGVVHVLRSQADGSLLTLDLLPLSGLPVASAIGDMDGASGADVVVLTVEGLVEVFLADGAGLYLPALATDAGEGVDLLLTDVDVDGVLDAVVAVAADRSVRVLAGQGDGSLATPVSYAARIVPTALAAGDLDGNGVPDLVVGGELDPLLPGNLAVLLGLHGGGFADPQLLSASADAGRPLVADFDKDGRLDLALLVPSGRQVDLYASAEPVWSNLGQSLGGAAGKSKQIGEGSLAPASTLGLHVAGALPLTPSVIVAGFAVLEAPFKGGVLVPVPLLVLPGPVTDAEGGLFLQAPWPGLPAGTSLVLQSWFVDGGAPFGVSSTNGVLGLVP